MKTIDIEGKHGKFQCLVDDEDYDWILSINNPSATSYGYARVYIKKSKPYRHEFVHVLILKKYGLWKRGQDTDHVNLNKMDNRKENLRACTRSQNRANVSKSNVTCPDSIYKGISIHYGKWRAALKIGQKHVFVSTFDNEKDAALAYDIKAKEYFGEFARLNFPDAPKEDIQRVMARISSQKRRLNGTSVYFGVSKDGNNWAFHYILNKKMFRKYGFKTELEAAIARNKFIEDNNLAVVKTNLNLA